MESFDLTPIQHPQEIHQWNELVPKRSIDGCIHHMIYAQCLKQPGREAICAWDGSLTYSELDYLSSSTMVALWYHGVGPEVIVPLLFEKSKWTAVAMLGVLKAGAAFVLLDPTHPVERLKRICENVKNNVIVTSKKNHEIGCHLAEFVVELPDSWQENQSALSMPDAALAVRADIIASKDITEIALLEETNRATSKNAAYISFTSGSTGKPKGVVIDHASICTNVLASSLAHNLDESSRVLQFASYAFDVSIHETLATLMLGGCVCIPSEVQRVNYLQETIIELGVNWLELTPSVARLLKPEDIPAVKTLVVGGESMSPVELARWASKVFLAIAYGPAECTVVSTVQTQLSPDADPFNIGRSYGGTTWVVDPDDHEKLVPIGVAGELVIGSPIVGRGYLHLPHQTAAAFITNPPWSRTRSGDRNSRFYKTGDLVRQQSNGSLVYLGRKDTQVKLRGQRIELEEIKHHAERLFLGAAVAVEMGKFYHEASVLALFVEWESIEDSGLQKNTDYLPITRETTELFTTTAQSARKALEAIFPRYMVPELFIPLRKLPLSPTAKVDRKTLRAMISDFSKSDLQEYRLLTKQATLKHGEQVQGGKLQAELIELVALVLSLDPEDIQGDDDFFQLGGDSVSAIMLARESQKLSGSSFTVTDIFQNSTISKLSQFAQSDKPQTCSASITLSTPPFSIPDDADLDKLKKLAVEQCGIFSGQIDDIYPCSPLQERFMARTARQADAFQARFTFRISKELSWSRLRKAWSTVADAYAILRTRIINASGIQSNYNTFQVVTRGTDIEWFETDAGGDRILECERQMGFGTPLFYIIARPESTNPTLSLAVHVAYLGQSVGVHHFSPFIKFIHDTKKLDTEKFWRKEFGGFGTPSLLAHIPTNCCSPQTIELTQRNFQIRLSNRKGATVSAMIRLAWAIAVAYYTGQLDVVFGVTVMGRSIQGAADIAGPTIATYPLRVILQQNLNLEETLQCMQDHNIELMPFEQTGIQEIQKASSEAAIACEFQSLLVVQPQTDKDIPINSEASSLWDLEETAEWKQQMYTNFSTQLLNIVCEPETEKLAVNAFFDNTILPLEQVEVMLHSFERALDILVNIPETKICDALESTGERALDMLIDDIRVKPCDSLEMNSELQGIVDNASLMKAEQMACEFLGDNFDVAADWIKPKAARTSELALFVGIEKENAVLEDALIFQNPGAGIRSQLSQLMLHMRNIANEVFLPRCCIPIRLECEPLKSENFKKRVRKAASELTWSALKSWENDETDSAISPLKKKLRNTLAEILRLEPTDIGIDDDFVSLGCDSLIAMQFASRCNRENLMVTILDIFEARSISRLALKAASPASRFSNTSENFSLVRSEYGDLQSFEDDVIGLNELLKTVRVIDAFPCTSAHLGLLPRDHLLQAHTIWKLSTAEDRIDPFKLAGAWRQLVDRHAALRTVLLQSKSNPSRLFHIVFSSAPIEVETVVDMEDANILSKIQEPYLSRCGNDGLPYKFTIYQTTEGQVLCKLEGRHAFLDATSVLILLQELGSLYHGHRIPTNKPLYRLWASYMQQWEQDCTHMQFWEQYLCNITPSTLTVNPQGVNGHHCGSLHEGVLQSHSMTITQTGALRQHCERLGFSMTNFFQVAWARVLQTYTGQDDVCFGSLVSGRDAPVPHVNDIVGAVFNVLVCRFLMVKDERHFDILKRNEAAMRERLAHQYCSLKDVTLACSGSSNSLFNTCLSVEQPLSSEGEVCFKELETHEETEYDLIVIVSVSPDIIRVQIVYWSSFLNVSQACELGDVFKQSIERIISYFEELNNDDTSVPY